jgi:hypothetical protein
MMDAAKNVNNDKYYKKDKLAKEAEAQMRKWKRETKEGNRFKRWEFYHREKYLKERELIDKDVDIEKL